MYAWLCLLYKISLSLQSFMPSHALSYDNFLQKKSPPLQGRVGWGLFRFLLAQAVETAEAPDNVGAVNANNLAVGEALSKYVKCFIVVL